MPVKLTIKQARQIAMRASLIDGHAQLPKKKNGVEEVINHLGYVQIDTVHIVERAHNHTLWTRLPDYKSDYLHELQSKERKVFEYWAHAMCYLPIDDFRYFIPHMTKYEKPFDKWAKARMERVGHMLDDIYNRVKNEGPLGASDFKEGNETRREGWWDWKLAKIALELLYWQGRLMFTERRNFHRIYDLTERVIPKTVSRKYPTKKEFNEYLIRRALQSKGIATAKEIADYFHHHGKKENILPLLEQKVKQKKVIEVEVGQLKETYFAYPETIDLLDTLKPVKKQVLIFCPFDNFIIQRDRIARLFNFDYTLECYIPAPKRKYGYFVLPVMYGDRFVARIDCKADRKKKELKVISVYFEDKFKPTQAFLKKFGKKLQAYAKFNNCETISVGKVKPSEWKRDLKMVT